MARTIILALAGLAASLALAVGLTAAGFAPKTTPAEAAPPALADPAVDASTPQKTAGTEVVYVKPAPKPRTIVKTVVDRPQRGTDYVAARPQRVARNTARAERDDREDGGREREEHESGERD
jgi:hypothetical protein